MIKKVEINNLFGRFDYSIELFSSGITIITGPNGFGKSTILRIIHAISIGKFDFFYEIEFQKIRVFFKNKSKTFVIEKNSEQLTIDGVKVGDLLTTLDDENRINLRHYFRPWVIKSSDGFYDRRNMETLSEERLLFRTIMDDDLLNHLSFSSSESVFTQFRETIKRTKELCGDVSFISDQRLIKTVPSRDEKKVIDVINELPEKLKKEISDVVADYSQKSTKLDSSYPRRLFSAKEGIMSQEEYDLKLSEANKKLEKLREYNLVDISLINEKKYNENYATALKIYFDDFALKYEVFEKLIQKLDLFTKIINDRLLFKKLRITQKNGFEIIDVDNPQKILDLSQLSSGEKQEIVLFYELIFETKEGLLLLIDEPEISLHIMWQKSFLDDLIEVSKLNKLQAIVATHSPQIIAKHLDLQIDLSRLYYERLYK